MKQLILLLMLLSLTQAGEYAVITSAKSPIDSLGVRFVKDIFLKKRTFYRDIDVIPINLGAASPIRLTFEKEVLGMERDYINEYWIVNHYKGIKPPLVQRSEMGIRAFVANQLNAIGYLRKELVDETVKVLYEF